VSLKTDFDSLVLAQTRSGMKPGEILLFRSLRDAFAMNVHAVEYHGSGHQVHFQDPYSQLCRCELCDLLVISVGKKHLRYTCLQAKYEKGGKGIFSFTGTARQHHLLSKLPVVIPTNPKIPATILSKHTLESVGTFGVFTKTPGGMFDMEYAIGSLLSPQRGLPSAATFRSNGNAQFGFVGKMNVINNMTSPFSAEIEGCDSIDTFETALSNMLIGQPILSRDGIRDTEEEYILNVFFRVIESNGDRKKGIDIKWVFESFEKRILRRDAVVLPKSVVIYVGQSKE